MPDEKRGADAQAAADGSVVDQILLAFLAKVEADVGLADIGGRLRMLLLEKREDAEAELRAAIFGGGPE